MAKTSFVLSAVAAAVTRRPRLVVSGAAALAAVALVFGAGVAKHLGPFGFDDPATESVKAREAVERAAGYDPDLVLTAIVRPFTRRNVERTVARLRAEPATARVLSVYSTGDRAMVSRDGRAIVRPRVVQAARRPGPRPGREANREAVRTTTRRSRSAAE